MAKHVDHLLTAYVHGELDPATRGKVEEHLRECRSCCEEYRRLRSLISQLGCLKVEPAPEQWKRICEDSRPRIVRRPGWSMAFAFVGVAAGIAVVLAVYRPPVVERSTVATGPGFQILDVSGSVSVSQVRADKGGMVRQGQTLRTSRGAEARIEVANIGEITIGGDSEIQLVATTPKQHRMKLARGRLTAKVTAPPRLFVVETPSGDAVDLGCAYTLDVDDAGNVTLQVQTGWVAMERNGPDGIVPAGWTLVTRKAEGVGTPVCGTAPPEFRKNLEEWDICKTPAALQRALKTARARDGLSLWHLLSRTDEAGRREVFEALVSRHPLPKGVSEAAVMDLDTKALVAWREAILWPPGSGVIMPFGLGPIILPNKKK